MQIRTASQPAKATQTESFRSYSYSKARNEN